MASLAASTRACFLVQSRTAPSISGPAHLRRVPVLRFSRCPAQSHFPQSRGISIRSSVAVDPNAKPNYSEGEGPVTWVLTLFSHAPPAKEHAELGLEITVVGLDGHELGPFALDEHNHGGPQPLARIREFLPGRSDSFSIRMPSGFEPAAVKIRNVADKGASIFQAKGHHEFFYIERLHLQSGGAEVVFLANSYVSPVQGDRLFMRSDAWSNPTFRNNEVIVELQEEELLAMRGEGAYAALAKKERKPGDRVYRFARYNDLGKDPRNPKNVRPILGGSAQFKYPRRLETNRPLYPGTEFETPPKRGSGVLEMMGFLGSLTSRALDTPWVPEDDNFSQGKSQGFVGNALLEAVPSAMDLASASLQGLEFPSIAAVLHFFHDPESLGWPEDVHRKDLSTFNPGKSAPKINLRTGQGAAASDSNAHHIFDGSSAPRSLANRLETWASDEEFGRLFLAGQNPLVLKAIDSQEALDTHLGSSAVRDVDILNLLEGSTFSELAAEAAGGAEPRLFVVDYWALIEVLSLSNTEKGKVLHAARAVLFRRADGYLVPVGIELASSKDTPVTAVTPNDPRTLWLLAKCIFMSVDTGYHQIMSHFVRTHACIEPCLIALRRQLFPHHPIFRLMIPHFHYTLPINAAARSILICANGAIEGNFTPGAFSIPLSSVLYGLEWQFKDQGLPADLKKRGIMDASGALKVPDYPYAEDGLLIWEALHQYFTDYVNLYYPSDVDVLNDKYVVAWWKDIRENGHPDITTGWIELEGKQSLVEILCTIAWVASAHHAAVNFGQYDYCGWSVLHSTLCRKAVPLRGSDDWKFLADLDVYSHQYQATFEKELLKYFATPLNAAIAVAVLKVLSAHAEDEQYLSAGPERQDWLPFEADPELKGIFMKFLGNIQSIDAVVDARNQEPQRLSRTPEKGGLAYTLLRPTSKGPGITCEGVPYSISI